MPRFRPAARSAPPPPTARTPVVAALLAGLAASALGACGFGAGDAEREGAIAGALWLGEPHTVISEGQARAEVAEKMDRVRGFLDERGLDGILLRQVRNVSWITAGLATNQIVLNKDVGVGALLILRDGSQYLLSTSSESDRLMDQALRAQGYEARLFDWFAANSARDERAALVRELAGGGRVGADVAYPGTAPVADAFVRLRYRLTDPEIERYRWLGRETTEAVQGVLRRVEPGMEEYAIEALTAAALRARGIVPTVLLIAVDDRIRRYRHALPDGAVLDRYVMVNVVAEKWDMSMAVTRFAHFGPPPDDLARRFERTARVNAEFQRATVPGTPAVELYGRMKRWYHQVGHPDEWRKHHQGGAIGYDDRDWIIHPGIAERVHARQAFAWNPTITGAKVEDTMIVFDDGFEVVTRAGEWPMIEVTLDGRVYEQPGVLIR